MDARSVVHAQGLRVACRSETRLYYPLQLCQTVDGRWNGYIGLHSSFSLRDFTENDDHKYQEELINTLGGTTYTGVCDRCRYSLVQSLAQ